MLTKKKVTKRKTTKKKRSSAPKTERKAPAKDERFHRPEPERTEPRRSWGGSPWNARPPGYGPFGTSGHPAPDAAGYPDAPGLGADLGQRVVDDYLREEGRHDPPGYGNANPFWRPADTPFRAPGAGVPLGSLWLEMLSSIASTLRSMGLGYRPFDPNPRADGPFGFGAPTAGNAGGTALSVQVSSRRPVEVTVELQAGAAAHRLTAHLANLDDPALPPLTDVAFDATGDSRSPGVRLRVPDDAAAGLYAGAVLDRELGRALGTLMVRVGD